MAIDEVLTMPRLSQFDRARALGMLLAGATATDVAARFNVNRSTINRIRTPVRTTASVADRPRSGRPRATTQEQDRFLVIQYLQNRRRNAEQTARETPGRHNPRISGQTVRRRLRAVGLRSRRPFRGNQLTAVRRQRRMVWCRQHVF